MSLPQLPQGITLAGLDGTRQNGSYFITSRSSHRALATPHAKRCGIMILRLCSSSEVEELCHGMESIESMESYLAPHCGIYLPAIQHRDPPRHELASHTTPAIEMWLIVSMNPR